MTTPTLSTAEVEDLTRYKQAYRQLKELHRRGFSRAIIDRNGQVLLERAHYEAVCRGAVEVPRARVKPPVLPARGARHA